MTTPHDVPHPILQERDMTIHRGHDRDHDPRILDARGAKA
jgi:hypothetical protein